MVRKLLLRGFLTFLVSSFAVSASWASKLHPYDQNFEERFQSESVQTTLKRLEKKLYEVKELLKMDPENDAEDVAEDDLVIALEQAIETIKGTEGITDQNLLRKKMNLAWTLENAVRMEGKRTLFGHIKYYLKAMSAKWTIPLQSEAEDEASNLYDGGQYLSLNDLESPEKDISTLDPSPDSYFWQRPQNLSQRNIRNVAKGIGVPMYEDIKVKFPEDNVFYYKEMTKRQSKPKLNVYTLTKKGKKKKFKIKFGSETHSEPTISVLLNTLGFHSDLSKYARGIKVILGDFTLSELTREWESYFSAEPSFTFGFKIEDFILDHGSDENGNYVIFKEGLIEAKPKKLDRIGPWAYEDGSHNSFREVRGLLLTNIWLAAADIKEMDNNRVVLKGQQPYLMISDAGYGLGHFIKESPGIFPADLVKRKSRSEITLKFLSLQNQTIRDRMTYADARWATRLIATLTREQINTAVTLGGWPQCIVNIYTEKLINRRNQLVEALDLKGEFSIYPVDKKYLGRRVKNMCDNMDEIKRDFYTDFEFTIPHFLKANSDAIKTAFQEVARVGVNSTSKITLSERDFDDDRGIVGELIIDFKRIIDRNSESKRHDDKYLVKDSFELGITLGYGAGVFAGRKLSRKYTLVYPVQRKSHVGDGWSAVADFLLAGKVKRLELPEKYVLMTENYADWRFGVEIEDHNGSLPLSPGLEIGRSHVLLNRTVADGRDTDQILIYRDEADYARNFFELFGRLGFYKMRILEGFKSSGDAEGKFYQFSKEDLLSKPELVEAYRRSVTDGDMKHFAGYAMGMDVTNLFEEKGLDFKFLIWRWSSSSRTDSLEITRKVGEDTKTDAWIQHQREKSSGWSWPGNSETRSTTVRAFLTHTGGEALTYGLEMDIVTEDLDTKTEELEDEYLAFMNGINIDDEKLIPFTPSMGYSRNDKWGHLFSDTHIEFYHEGLQNILNATDNWYWTHLAHQLKINGEQLNEELQSYLDYTAWDGSPLQRLKKRKYPAWRGKIYEKAYIIIDKLNDAREAKSLEKQVKYLAKALHKASYKTSAEGVYLLRAFQSLAGRDNHYIRTSLHMPENVEVKLIGRVEPLAEWGKKRELGPKYILYSPSEAEEIYFMLDSFLQ